MKFMDFRRRLSNEHKVVKVQQALSAHVVALYAYLMVITNALHRSHFYEPIFEFFNSE